MAPNAPQPPGGAKSNTPMIIGGIVFLLILLVLGYMMMSKGSSAEASAGGAASVGGGMPPPPLMAAASTTTAAATAPPPPPMPALSTLNTAAAYVGPSAGSTYPGNDLGNFSNADPNFCADKCNNTPGCIGFTVDTGGQGCYLKSKFDAPVASTTTNAYTKPGTVLPDGASKYQPPITGHFLGNELGSFANIDPNFCAAKCNSTQGCVAFETDAANCIVKSQLTNPIDTSNPAVKVYKKTGVTPIDPSSVTQKQTIQAEPLEIGIASVTFAAAPTGYITQTAPTFTMTMDLWIQAAAPTWRNIFNHGPVSGGECCGGPQMRKPAMYITGNDTAPANRIHVCMNQAAANDNTNIVTQAVVAPATWTKVAIVVSGGSMSVYVNGTLDPAGTVTGNFVWPSPDQPWTWMTPQYLGNAYGSVQVRNAFFWPFALTAGQIGAVTPTSSTAALPNQALPAPPAVASVASVAAGQIVELDSAITGPGTIALRPEAYALVVNVLTPGKQFIITNGNLSNGSPVPPSTVYTVTSYTPMNIQAAGWYQFNFTPADTFKEHSAFKALVSGAVSTDVPGYKSISGLDFPGNDLAVIATNNVNECSAKCNTRDDCKGFVLATDSQNCWLKGSFGRAIPNRVRPTYVKSQKSLLAGIFGGHKVTLYADCNWGGAAVPLPAGAYPSLSAAGFYDNALSGVRVPLGMSITIYDQYNFQGNALRINRDEACFVYAAAWNPNGIWNDKAKSAIIF